MTDQDLLAAIRASDPLVRELCEALEDTGEAGKPWLTDYRLWGGEPAKRRARALRALYDRWKHTPPPQPQGGEEEHDPATDDDERCESCERLFGMEDLHRTADDVLLCGPCMKALLKEERDAKAGTEQALPCPFCGAEAIRDGGDAGCSNGECVGSLLSVAWWLWNRRAPAPPDPVREAAMAWASLYDDSSAHSIAVHKAQQAALAACRRAREEASRG